MDGPGYLTDEKDRREDETRKLSVYSRARRFVIPQSGSPGHLRDADQNPVSEKSPKPCRGMGVVLQRTYQR